MPLLDRLSDGYGKGSRHVGHESHAQYEKGRKRTEKARMQLNANRAVKQAEANKSDSAAAQAESSRGLEILGSKSSFRDNFAQRLQKQFFSSSFLARATDDRGRTNGRERARCAYSLLKQIVGRITQLFQKQQIQHAINVVVADDTSTRMRGPNVTDRSTVFSIMNTIQSLHVDTGEWPLSSMFVPTPMICLPSQKGETIHLAYSSCLTLGAGGAGEMLVRLGLKKNLAPNTTWQTQLMMGDALLANDKAFKLERNLLSFLHGKGEAQKRMAIRWKCQVHQVSLIRRPVVLSIPSYWSSLVRLAHLFESYSYRKEFASSLLSLLQGPSGFQRFFGLVWHLIHVCVLCLLFVVLIYVS